MAHETLAQKKRKASQKKHLPKKSEVPIDQPGTGISPVLFSPGDVFPIVGIGASAGGLSAFEAFFSGMPVDADPGMAFVLVQHLAPDHKSMLTELVQRYTRMQVFEVEDGVQVKPNCTYILPPNRDLALQNGKLQLFEQSHARGQRLPIDFFFSSLAQNRHEKAICIILSGTGSDGTRGLRAIKAEGGLVMVQNPESTTYNGMPLSAIATGMVDYVLPPAAMPVQLITYVAQVYGKFSFGKSAPKLKIEGTLEKIFLLLRSQTGHDFSLYKEKTINRRVERRMALHQIDQQKNYLKYLEQNPDEVNALFGDLLISVTGFFRDPEAFAILAERVIPDLLKKKPEGAFLRIWVPGCSTGEEAYSIAILFQECMETVKRSLPIQIFATDIDSRAIEIARAGIYPSGIAADVSMQRLSQFFNHDENQDTFRVKKRIRDVLVFSVQNVISDPPFSRLDMISCRNVLIYLSADLQNKLIPLFHYALNPGGTLFLGTSETVGNFVTLFSVSDKKAKLYERNGDLFTTHYFRTVVKPSLALHNTVRPSVPLQKNGLKNTDFRAVVEKIFLKHFDPIGALVNNRGDILYLYGRTGRFLEPSPGEADMNIIRMAREGLRAHLTAALRKADEQKKAVSCSGVRVKTNGEFTTINLTVQPVPATEETYQGSQQLLVIFENVPETHEGLSPVVAVPAASETHTGVISGRHQRIAELEQELRVKEEFLQTVIEELNSSNEEMQSINEELQSTNEELETSKEELQSVNEELATVNVELQTKVADLTRINNDMNNLLAGTGIGTIFVDNQMCIRRFTPAVTRVINLIVSDVGRPLHHVVSNVIGYDKLTEDIQAVLDTLLLKETEVQTREGRKYLLRIQPYRTLENVIEGAVITFIDISKKPSRNV